jgi:hypothetical protein
MLLLLLLLQQAWALGRQHPLGEGGNNTEGGGGGQGGALKGLQEEKKEVDKERERGERGGPHS